MVTKEHLSSYVVDLGDDSYLALHLAAREAARRLDAAFPDVARTGIIYEGYGVDHAHAKLFPMHGTSGNSGADWRAVESDVDLYFERYQGYLSSHDHGRADDDELTRLARRIRTSL
ncbi:hypothetical protein GCM10027294_50920 [Marinactinospora endophytica]